MINQMLNHNKLKNKEMTFKFLLNKINQLTNQNQKLQNNKTLRLKIDYLASYFRNLKIIYNSHQD